MENYNPRYAYNIIRDWNQLQGTTHPSDEYVQIRRDLNARYITIENSGERWVGIAITTYWCGELPKLQFILGPGEIKHLGINTHGGPMQFIHMLDPETQLSVGTPTAINTRANSFVIRDGIQKMFIQFYYRPVYTASK